MPKEGSNKMKWYFELFDFLVFWLCGGIGFKVFWESSLMNFEFWFIAMPLIIVAHKGTQYLAKLDSKRMRCDG
jgi:hypothetical protein